MGVRVNERGGGRRNGEEWEENVEMMTARRHSDCRTWELKKRPGFGDILYGNLSSCYSNFYGNQFIEIHLPDTFTTLERNNYLGDKWK